MPLPVIAGVHRCTLLWNEHDGVTPRNVMHVRSTLGDPLDVGAALLETFHDARADGEPMQYVNSTYAFHSVEVLPLDGSTASVTYSDLARAVVGQDSGNVLPAVSNIVSLRTGIRGPRGRGRLYLGPCGENQFSAGLFSTSVLDDVQTSWDVMISAGPSHDIELGVASYAHADFNPAITATVEVVAGTQRRRQNQLR